MTDLSHIPRDALDKLLFFRQEFDKLFRRFFQTADPSLVESANIIMPYDIIETPEEILMEIELAGITKENVELYVLRDILIIEGQRESPPMEGHNFICMERNFGAFRRVIEVPAAAHTAHVSAQLKDGVLSIRFPIITERRGQRRKIEIQ